MEGCHVTPDIVILILACSDISITKPVFVQGEVIRGSDVTGTLAVAQSGWFSS